MRSSDIAARAFRQIGKRLARAPGAHGTAPRPRCVGLHQTSAICSCSARKVSYVRRAPCGGKDHRLDQHQAADQIGPLQRDPQADRAAETVAEQIDRTALSQPLRPERRRSGSSGRADLVLPVPIGRTAVAGLIQRGDRHARKPFGQPRPGTAMRQTAMQRQHRAGAPRSQTRQGVGGPATRSSGMALPFGNRVAIAADSPRIKPSCRRSETSVPRPFAPARPGAMPAAI